jgi:CheY-like chemotaxis protein
LASFEGVIDAVDHGDRAVEGRARRDAMPLAGKRVLVAEDYPDTLRYFVAVLSDELGVEVDIAIDGQAALDAVRRAPPDLLLLDLALPRISGVTVARQLKEEADTRDIPIVGVSGELRAGNEAAVHLLGLDELLQKPIAPELLADRVRAWLTA